MKFEVWSEGYYATGCEGPARAVKHGEVEADNFKEACRKVMAHCSNPESFDLETLSYWGCRLFDNEEDARKSFG